MTEHAPSRRSALTAAGAVVAGGVVGYVAGRNTDAAQGAAPATTENPYGHQPSGGKALAKVADIPDGGGVIRDGVVITRSGTSVHAFSATCTHQGCQVNQVSDGTIDCPCHGSKFDAKTGDVVAGPAPSPLHAVAVSVRNGEVFSA
jgi:Rieske Fe-S protein